MLGPLEDEVRKFAQRSRDRLLEEIRIKKNNDTAEAVWQGFDSNGMAIVKYDDKTKKVKGLGNASKIKGQKVLVDKVSTAEYEKLSDKKKEPKVKATTQTKTRIPTREDMVMPFQMPLGGEEEKIWVLAYLTKQDLTSERSKANAEVPGNFSSGSWSDTQNIGEDENASTYGEQYSIYGAAAVAGAQFGTCSASATGPVSASASASSFGSVVTNWDLQLGFAQGHKTGALTANASSFGDPASPILNLNGGLAEGESFCLNFTLPNGYLYIEWDDMGEGVEPIKINLNDTAPSSIVYQRIVHFFCERNQSNEVIAYVIVNVSICDFSVQNTQTFGGTNTNYETKILRIGATGKGVIHLEVNLTTGSVIQSKYTAIPSYTSTYFVSASVSAGSGSDGPFANAGGGYSGMRIYRDDLKSITECYQGDWMYPFRGTAWDSTAQANLDYEDEVLRFLSCSYAKEVETYFYGINSICPKVSDYNQGSTAYQQGNISAWTPLETDNFYGNTPSYGNYQDIEGLAATITTGLNSTHANYDSGFNDLNPQWSESFYDKKRMAPLFPSATEVRWGIDAGTSDGEHGDDIEYDFFMSLVYKP